MALTDKLSAIGDAIRTKGGTTELLKLDDMPAAITNLPSGGGGAEIEPFVLSGDLGNDNGNSLIPKAYEILGKYITTQDINNIYYAFANFQGKEIPFSINCSMWSRTHSDSIFMSCSNLETCPEINGLFPGRLREAFMYCYRLRSFPENFAANWDFSGMHEMTQDMSNTFYECYSLRNIPEVLLSNFYTARNSTGPYVGMFFSCYTLNEIRNLGVQPSMSSDSFWDTFSRCSMLKSLTFTPGKTADWSNQTINLSNYVGYAGDPEWIQNYNSGITDNSLKITDAMRWDDYYFEQDCWTEDPAYSKYTRVSAEETLQSLPTVTGSGNTIIFKERQGEGTSDGAIGDMDQSVIAAAAAKGWTVSFV